MAALVYKKHTEVYNDLLVLLRDFTRQGRFVLPPERSLADQLETSYMTLRKALKCAEMDGLIVREKRKTLIVDHGSDLVNCGRVLFVFAGKNGRFVHLAQERLYLKLCLEAKLRGADIRLLLLPTFLESAKESDFCRYEKELSEARVVIFGIKDCSVFFDSRGEKILNKAKKDPDRIFLKIAMDGMDLCENAIMLDEFAIGALAAELLAEGGAKRPVLPVKPAYFTEEGSMRHSRMDAFLKGCHAHGMEPLFPEVRDIASKRWFFDMEEILLDAWKKDHCDSAFLLSDLFLDVVLRDFFLDELIPSRFQVVAASDTDNVQNNTIPVTGIGHNTELLLENLLSFLKDLSQEKTNGRIFRLLEPELYSNHTVLNEGKTWDAIGA